MSTKAKVGVIDLQEVMEKLRGKGSGRARSLEDALGDDVPDEVKELLGEIIAEQRGEGGSAKKFGDVLESQAELMNFMSQPVPKTGVLVERNEFGMQRYNSPKVEDKESAVVVDVWPSYQQDADGNGVCNGVIAVTNRKSIVRLHAVDLRFYREVKLAARAGVSH